MIVEIHPKMTTWYAQITFVFHSQRNYLKSPDEIGLSIDDKIGLHFAPLLGLCAQTSARKCSIRRITLESNVQVFFDQVCYYLPVHLFHVLSSSEKIKSSVWSMDHLTLFSFSRLSISSKHQLNFILVLMDSSNDIRQIFPCDDCVLLDDVQSSMKTLIEYLLRYNII